MTSIYCIASHISPQSLPPSTNRDFTVKGRFYGRFSGKLQLLAFSLGCWFTSPSYATAGSQFTLKDGSRLEVFAILPGTPTTKPNEYLFNFDSRTLTEKGYSNLPDWIKDKKWVTPQGGRGSMISNRALGIGLRSEVFYRMFPVQSEVFLSNDAGWYGTSDSALITMNLKGQFVKHPPRTSEKLTLSVYEQSGKSKTPLGKIEFRNPQYNSSLPVTKPIPFVPKDYTVGLLTFRIKNLITGAHLETYLRNGSLIHSSDFLQELTSNISRAAMPQIPCTVLLFDVETTQPGVINLNIPLLEYTDSGGNRFGQRREIVLIRSENHYALFWPDNIPVTDGNWQFDFAFRIPANGSECEESAPFSFSSECSGTLVLKETTFNYQKATQNQYMSLTICHDKTATLNWRDFIYEVKDSLTSESLNFDVNQTHIDFKTRTEKIDVLVPDLEISTTRTATLSIRESTSAPLSFKALPTLPGKFPK